MTFKQKTLKVYYFFRNLIDNFYSFIVRPIVFGVKIVVENNNKLLFVRISYAHKKWVFPGGGINKGESFEQAAIRELKEETGIETDSLIEMGEYRLNRNYKKNIVKCFYLNTESSFVKIDNFEISEYAWFYENKIPKDSSFSVPQILEVYNKFKAK